MHPAIRTPSVFPSALPQRRRRRGATEAAALHRAVDNILEPLESRRLFAVTRDGRRWRAHGDR
jgi:hypothetical protein